MAATHKKLNVYSVNSSGSSFTFFFSDQMKLAFCSPLSFSRARGGAFEIRSGDDEGRKQQERGKKWMAERLVTLPAKQVA
jgi:hypothetical protein